MSCNSGRCSHQPPHIVLFPSAGMGHLTPFLRLAAMLSSRHCLVSLVTALPTVSAAESDHISEFLAAYPQIKRIEFHLIPSSSNPTTDDPFYLQFEAISRSVHLLRPSLSALSPPVSATFSDFAVASDFTKIAADLCVPNYILVPTSARFFSFLATIPLLISDGSKLSAGCGSVELPFPGLDPLPESSIPPPFFNPKHLFMELTVSNSAKLPKAAGFLLNTFEAFEAESISAFNNGRSTVNLPPNIPNGPLLPYEKDKSVVPSWLDHQEPDSVVYVSFGSRTAMAKEQIKELGDGLQRSGCRFLWALKTTKVDKDDGGEETQLLGESFMEKTKERGVVVRGWVKQEEILAHPAVGGFVNHCGWNSVTEAARHGVRMLAWPQHGDQRANAEVVEKAGLGIWVREWGWGVLQGNVVSGEEIGKKIEELMRDEKWRASAGRVGEEARKAAGKGGGSDKVLMGVIHGLKK